jgi:hypothetical protein
MDLNSQLMYGYRKSIQGDGHEHRCDVSALRSPERSVLEDFREPDSGHRVRICSLKRETNTTEMRCEQPIISSIMLFAPSLLQYKLLVQIS